MNYISLFSSSGVGCHGFLEEGFTCVATSELIARRLEVQKANKKVKYSDGYILGDISKIEIKNEIYKAVENFKNMEKTNDIDALIFTAPCQGMSVANHKKNDGTIEKNSLVIEALEVINEIKPNFFIAENVRSFMNTQCIDHNKPKLIKEAIKDWLSNEYYYMDKIINFKDYGANSSRTRTIVIGVRKNKYEFETLESIFPKKERVKSLKEVIGHLPSLNKMGEIWPTDIYHNFKPYRSNMREWINELKEGESAFDNENENKRPHRIINGKIVKNVNKNGDKYKRQVWDKVAPCVHTRNDIISSQNTVHPKDDRVFSIRELMLMMNIPDNFKWTSDYEFNELNRLTLTEKKEFLKRNEINIRQSIGEAIPTVIVRKIARNIKNVLKEKNYGKETKKYYQQV